MPGLFDGALSAILSGILILLRTPNYPAGPALSVRCGAQPADYANRQRLKILARIEVRDAQEAPDLIKKLAVPDYQARIERAMILRVEAYDWNCSQHITPKYTSDEIQFLIAPLQERIEALEAENNRLREPPLELEDLFSPRRKGAKAQSGAT